MLTPEYLLRVSEGAEEIASQLHIDIINRITSRIMHRMGRGDSYILTATDKWNIETLQEAGYLLEDIQQDIADKTKLQTAEIKAAMEEAGVTALEYDDITYKAAGLSTVPLWESPNLVRLMQRNYEATLGEWDNFTRSTATEAQKTFIQACDKAYNNTMTGAMSYTQAVKEAVEDVAREGVKITYPSGHSDTIETATLRSVRTGVAQATGDIQIARMEERDWDIILVSGHIGARTGDGGENPGNHFWWQSKFYSRSGNSDKFPPFSETGYGTIAGLCGVNCAHSFGAGDGENNPFEQFNSEENEKAEELSKRQRELERRIRKTKRQVVAMQTAVDEAEDEQLKFELQQSLDRKSNLLQKQNKAYNEFCKEKDLKRLQDRLKIAEWNRETAAKARAAARRYESANK